MRSRYSAFSVGNADYLLRTWHPDTCPVELNLDRGMRWTGLKILGVTRGTMFDTVGTVEFEAHYRDRVGNDVLHENSAFVREDGQWFYIRSVVEG